jgi:hypothetical protein
MRYMMLSPEDQRTMLSDLAAMPDFLEAAFGALPPDAITRRGPDDTFSPVEHCWHLADLEREGYAVRIQRLRSEDDPALRDFDGARIAEERDYRALDWRMGLSTFRAARGANLRALRALTEAEWLRAGSQEGVGKLTLCDLPAMMAEHDHGHRQEIAAWLESHRAE